MKRFWASWVSGNYADEGCSKPPFKFWVSGSIARPNLGLTPAQMQKYRRLREDESDAEAFLDTYSRDNLTLCAVVDAESEDDVWVLVAKHYPDYKPRFCEEKEPDFKPGDRFQ